MVTPPTTIETIPMKWKGTSHITAKKTMEFSMLSACVVKWGYSTIVGCLAPRLYK
uniref:Uncharacterized protein n=1 Tax=Picea glauca TaxID=3330 RepID=A0A117NGW1_PICGL|nr:hypothetical protein ABT39_MTgene5605 [Picea glauca]QHR87841.1 hypothetical protein Q903MT_gene1853 [Picea sitchensis]